MKLIIYEWKHEHTSYICTVILIFLIRSNITPMYPKVWLIIYQIQRVYFIFIPIFFYSVLTSNESHNIYLINIAIKLSFSPILSTKHRLESSTRTLRLITPRHIQTRETERRKRKEGERSGNRRIMRKTRVKTEQTRGFRKRPRISVWTVPRGILSSYGRLVHSHRDNFSSPQTRRSPPRTKLTEAGG